MNKINLNVYLDCYQKENLKREINSTKCYLDSLMSNQSTQEKQVFTRYMSTYLNDLFEHSLEKDACLSSVPDSLANIQKNIKDSNTKKDCSVNIVPDTLLKSINVGF